MKHYYINLAGRTDRKQNMIDLFAKLDIKNYERIEAVDGNLVDYEKVLANGMKVCRNWLDPIEDRPLTKGEVGCILSHIVAWSKISQSGLPGVILEDDLYHNSNTYNIQQITERLDDFDLVYLSKYNMDENSKGFDEVFEIPGYCYWTSGYAVSVKGAQMLLNSVGIQNLIPADEYLPMMLGTSPLLDKYPQFKKLTKLKGLAYKENVFQQHSRNTAIGKTDTENLNSFKEWKNFNLLTVATESAKAEQLINSCKNNDLKLEMLGVGESWQGGDMQSGPGGGHKVHYLRSRLRNVDDHDIVMFVDGYDVIINDSQEELIKRFKQFGADVVFGAEPPCWPDDSIAEQFPKVHTRNRFLNSGGFIGRADVIKEMLRTDIAKADDDQLYYQKIFLSGKFNIRLDVENYLFQCVSMSADSLVVRNNQVYNNETGCFSVVLHGNGGTEDKKAYKKIVNQLLNKGSIIPLSIAKYNKIWTVSDDIIAFDYMTPQMCDDLIGACDERGGWEPRPDDAYPAQEIRIKELCPNLYTELEKHLTDTIWPQLEAYWPPMSMYGIRDFFAMRYSLDTQTSLNLHNDASMVSGSLKLNEDYQGAELSFPRQHFTNRHIPRGVMLMWPGQVTHPHVCEELEEGVKYSLTLWTKRFTQDT